MEVTVQLIWNRAVKIKLQINSTAFFFFSGKLLYQFSIYSILIFLFVMSLYNVCTHFLACESRESQPPWSDLFFIFLFILSYNGANCFFFLSYYLN